MWINLAVFLSLQLVKKKYYGELPYIQVILDVIGLNPAQVYENHTIWQVLTYAFVHVSFFHLLFNMLALWWFGSDVELHLGTKKFIHYYFFTAIGAGLVSTALNISTIGASGAVYGLLLAYGLMFPNRILYVYFVIPIKAKYCVFLFGLLELVALLGADPSNINHTAHLSGIFFGLLWFFSPTRGIAILDLWKNYQKLKMRKRLKILKQNQVDAADEADDFDNPTIH